jgi:hypothetical protein
MCGGALLRNATDVVVRNSFLEIQSEENHDGFGNISPELETAPPRLGDAKTRPESLLTFFHLLSVALNERTVYFNPNRSGCAVGFRLTNIGYGHDSHLIGNVLDTESSQG